MIDHVGNNSESEKSISSELAVHINRLYRDKMARRKQSIRVQIHLTDKCENKCYYCYIDGCRDREMTFDTFVEIVDRLIKYSIAIGMPLFICLIGGNPLLAASINDCLDYLNDNRIDFYIICNPSTLTGKRAKFLNRYSFLKGVQFTLAGDETTHKRIRGHKDFNSLIYSTLYLTRLGTPVGWRLNIDKHYLDRVGSIFKAISYARPTLIGLNRLCNIGSAAGLLDRMSANEFRSILDSFFRHYCVHYHKGVRFSFKEHLWFPYLVEEGIIDLAHFQNIIGGECRCRFFYEQYVIDVDGAVYLCRKLPHMSLGNCLTEGFNDLISKSNRNSYINPESYIKCRYCKYSRWCMGCPAISASFGEGIFSADPHCWVDVPNAN